MADESVTAVWSRTTSAWTASASALVAKSAHAWPLVGVLVLAVVVRSYYLLGKSFPLNDGGLFYLMATEIREAGYTLPHFTSYNNGSIPFAYSPLSLYLAAALDHLTPLTLLDVFLVVPFLGSLLAVVAVFLLARSILGGRSGPLAAALAFAVVPRSFIWLIMGGGLPRSLGLAFALLALWQLHLAFQSPRRSYLAGAAAFSALTILTHLETAAFLAVSMVFFALARWSWRALASLTLVGSAAILATAPWWGLVLMRHGIETFLAATDHGGSLLANGAPSPDFWLRLLTPVYTGETYFPVVAALGVLGAAYSLSRGRWLLPVWLVLIVFLDMPAFMTYVAVPTAMLVGVAVEAVLVPTFREQLQGGRLSREFPGSMLVAGCILGFVVGSTFDASRGELPYLSSLRDTDLAAMTWVAEHTPAGARFLVVPLNGWWGDRDGEWFPVIAQRESVVTVQGYEWIQGAFNHRAALHGQAWGCGGQEASCLEDLWSATRFTHVYIPPFCCDTLRASLLADGRYEVLYDQGGATILARSRTGLGEE